METLKVSSVNMLTLLQLLIEYLSTSNLQRYQDSRHKQIKGKTWEGTQQIACNYAVYKVLHYSRNEQKGRR